MFTLLAYTKSQAIVATPTALTAIFDGYASISPVSGNYLLPKPMYWMAGIGIGANIGQARLNTPSLRQVSLPQMFPLNVGAAPVSLLPIVNYGRNGPMIPATDEISFETTNGGGGAEQQFGLLWFSDGNMNVPAGDIITVRGTATNTGGNLTWGPSTFTFDQVLPSGNYSIIGMDVIGANLIAARLRLPNIPQLPGVLARQAQATLPNLMFRNGAMGEFGRFANTAPPNIEVLGSAAGTTQTILLDLVKL